MEQEKKEMRERDAYVERMKAKLDEWNAEIKVLEARAKQFQAQKKIDYQEQINGLKGKRDELKEKLRKLGNASEGAWQEIKIASDQAWDKLKDGIKRARNYFD